MNPSTQTPSTHTETSTSSSESEQKTRTENDYTEQSKNTPRSKAAHLGITIRRGGPACGRTANPDAAPVRAAIGFMIVSGWSGC
ncbi:hypothetical protein FRP1_16620 [Pseudonocardia sp. EC080625-04]|nr:hypothetical protein FRP1_16620 [Pseudonocardia sp. EC080625-04]